MWWRRSARCSKRPKRPRSRSPFAHLGQWLGRPMRVHGTSMLPLLRPGDVILVQESAYHCRAPRRGEVVVARPSSLSGRAFVKRILGTPHEEVACASRTWSLGPDEYFLLGDHPEESLDSRTLGPMTRRELIGRVWLRVWPPRVLREPA